MCLGSDIMPKDVVVVDVHIGGNVDVKSDGICWKEHQAGSGCAYAPLPQGLRSDGKGIRGQGDIGVNRRDNGALRPGNIRRNYFDRSESLHFVLGNTTRPMLLEIALAFE